MCSWQMRALRIAGVSPYLLSSKPPADRHVTHSSDARPGSPNCARPLMSLVPGLLRRAWCNCPNPRGEAIMPLRETEFESEFESEFEDESELEGEFEGEEEGEDFDLGSVIGGLLGEGEFEEEYEGEEEGEEFDLGGVISGLLGEGEYEGEYEDESEEFFGNIARFVRKNAPLLKQVARIAAPMVGTAFGGPLGGALASKAVSALGEGEYELESEYEDEHEGEEEGEE